jgi:hypothetical protein
MRLHMVQTAARDRGADARHWKTPSFNAVLRHDRIDAPWVIHVPINGEFFTSHIEPVLVPTPAVGDVVILDKRGGHKGRRAWHAIWAFGASLIFLPACSPT